MAMQTGNQECLHSYYDASMQKPRSISNLYWSVTRLKGTQRFRVYFRPFYLLDGKCNAKYFKHANFYRKRRAIFQISQFNVLKCKRYKRKCVFCDFFSQFYIEIIVCVRSRTKFYCWWQFETISDVYSELRLHGLVVVTNSKNMTKYDYLFIMWTSTSYWNSKRISVVLRGGTHLFKIN